MRIAHQTLKNISATPPVTKPTDRALITVFEDGFERIYRVTAEGKRIIVSQKRIFWLDVQEKSNKRDRATVSELKQMHKAQGDTLAAQLQNIFPRLHLKL